jgi:hypothetical protein
MKISDAVKYPTINQTKKVLRLPKRNSFLPISKVEHLNPNNLIVNKDRTFTSKVPPLCRHSIPI